MKHKDYALQIHRNIYGQVQAGLVWNTYLIDKLKRIGFHQCESDPCVLIRDGVIYVVYIDDSLILGPDASQIDKCIKDMRSQDLHLTEEGGITDFLGVQFDTDDTTCRMSQPLLIDSILKELNLLRPKTKTKDTPMASSKILSRHPSSEDFDGNFHYRRVIGMLNYLQRCTRPDISYAVHQCARFCEQPKTEHGNAIKWLSR